MPSWETITSITSIRHFTLGAKGAAYVLFVRFTRARRRRASRIRLELGTVPRSASCFLSETSGWRDGALYPSAWGAAAERRGAANFILDRGNRPASLWISEDFGCWAQRRLLALIFGRHFIYWELSGESWPCVWLGRRFFYLTNSPAAVRARTLPCEYSFFDDVRSLSEPSGHQPASKTGWIGREWPKAAVRVVSFRRTSTSEIEGETRSEITVVQTQRRGWLHTICARLMLRLHDPCMA
jgi:hypothetical protein